MKISLCINVDTRNSNDEFTGNNLGGCVSDDFLTEGIYNKQCYLKGFDFETIVYVDRHNDIPEKTMEYLKNMTDCLIVRGHTSGNKFNDYNFLRAISMCSGEIILKVDQDTCCFTSSPQFIQNQIDLLEQYSFISYPSHCSPNPVHDNNYDYWWASTRYFMCKREFIDLTEIDKCLKSDEYLYGKYPASIRNPWLEHILGLQAKYNGKGVFYPPINYDDYMVFSWGRYEKYILNRLNSQSYNEVKDWVLSKGGIFYPNDVYC